MPATIAFYAGTSDPINNLAGSGLGFYGTAGFGTSVPVGEYQGRTYITNSAGTSQGPEASNIKWYSSESGVIGQSGSPINILNIPNYQATLNIRFTYDTPVQVQNARIKIYDRVSSSHSASGVTTQAAEIIHPNTSQVGTGSGDTTWTTFTSNGSGLQSLSLANSPGISGLYAGNGTASARADSRHDFYTILSSSPDAIGSKTFALLFSCEYL